MTAISNRWFVIPQQRYVQNRQEERHRRYLWLLLGVRRRLWPAQRVVSAAFAAYAPRRPDAWARARQAEQRFEAFMAHSPAVGFIKDSAGRHCYVNQAFVEIFGAPADNNSGQDG